MRPGRRRNHYVVKRRRLLVLVSALLAWTVRLWYAYADALQAAGRKDDAARWFAASAALDTTGETDAAERAAELL